MAALKSKIAKFSVNWHRTIRWFGGVTLLIWAVSGALHPIMSWTGPKAAKFFPPQFEIEQAQLAALATAIDEVVNTLGISQVKVAKVVPSSQGPLLQLTQEQFEERRYVSLASGEVLENHDIHQARWLASYYTGKPEDAVQHVEKIESFSAEYPWVNRLLPVYRVEFSGDEQRVAFVHTETGALASLSNSYKYSVQAIFKALHTWSWLDFAGFGRVLVIALLLMSLIAMVLTGMALIVTFSWRKFSDKKRQWHRMVSYVIWLPLLAWSVSGFYHLLQAEYVNRPTGMHLDQSFDLASMSMDVRRVDAMPIDKKLNAITLVRDQDSRMLMRLGLAQEHRGAVNREQKYRGQTSEKNAVYFDPGVGKVVDVSDRERAIWLASEHFHINEENILNTSLITRFGSGYDFRNKRLPVWHVEINDDAKTSLFIDPTTGILVDQSRQTDRMESWVFSMLHKWNFFNPFMSRQMRDVLILMILGLAIFFTGIGMTIHVRQKRRKPALVSGEPSPLLD